MPRVVGIDPGTVSFDVCGLDDGRVFLERSLPTDAALADPAAIVELLREAGELDLVAGPSGYGLPLVAVRDLSEHDLRLAYLAAEGESGGIGGLRSLMRALARTDVPVLLLPGVVHLPSVPAHRKINRVDMGTADKVCAAAFAIWQRAEAHAIAPQDVSAIVLELGGAFSAALAIDRGRIVDGLGGSSGPIGARAAGALDGEVAYLAGTVTKALLFRGGRADVGGTLGRDAYVEGAVKAVMSLTVAVPDAREVILSGRFASQDDIAVDIARRLADLHEDLVVHVLEATPGAGPAAFGAALLADGLTGGRAASLVDTMGLREAAGSVLDHLYVISPEAARARLGLA